MAKSKGPGWFEVLEAARRLSEDGSKRIGASALAADAGIPDTGKSTGSQIASGWLSKFVKWGYAVRSGTLEGDGAKWARGYMLTKFGFEVESRASNLDKLLDAVRAFKKDRSAKQEAAMIKVFDQIEKEIEDRREKREAKAK